MARDIESDVKKTDVRRGVRQGEPASKDPPRWRDGEATRPAGVDLLLRAVHCPQPPTPDDRVRLSTRVKAIMRRPTAGIGDDAAPQPSNDRGGRPTRK
jgi:hypothetical protein